MSRTLQQITIFVSGTSEVDAERAALRRIVGELNKRLEKTSAVTLRVVAWPEDTHPGVNSDPQAEISRQLGSTFDLNLGLLGTRFGTPTPRAGSGTEEEFEDALARFKKDSRSVRVFFYFKRSTDDPFTIDIEQLQMVKNFRDSLAQRGVLYRDFRDTAEFIYLVQDHLYNLVIDEWQGEAWKPVLPGDKNRTDPTTDASAPSEVVGSHPPKAKLGNVQVESRATMAVDSETDTEEFGFLEYMASYLDAANALTETITRMSQDMERMNEQIRARTAETELIRQEHERVKNVGGSRTQQDLITKSRDNVDHAAANLDEFVATMITNVEQYRSHSMEMFANLRRGLSASSQFDGGNSSENVSKNRDALASLIGVLRTIRESIGQFQSSINQVPALTGKFKRARRRTAEVLGEFIAEVSFTIDEAERLLKELGDQAPSGGTA